MEAYLPFALLGGSICGAVWWMFWRPIADRATPEQRRAKWPPQEDEARRAAQPGLRQALKPVPDAELKVSQGYYTLKAATIDGRSGQKLHYTIVTPADGDIQRVITFVHGYGDFHDWLMMNAIRACAKLFKAAVVGFDLPGHGRSDGFYAFVPDWFEFVGAAEDLMRNVSVPLCTSLAPTGSKPLKHFAYGISMGGGLLATVMLRPSGKELLDGVILDAPMLYVSDEIKPPWAVQMLFKHVIIKLPFVGSWPVAPSKDMLDRCVAAESLRDVMRNNPFAMNSKPRLTTAYSLAFQCPEWLESRLPFISLPFIILHGAADTVTDPAFSQKMYDVAKSHDKTLRLYDDTLHAECMLKEPAFRDLEVWFSTR